MSASRPQISEVKQRIVDLVYQHWVNHNEWPRRVRIKAQLHNENLDVDAIEELYPLVTNNGDPIELSLAGFAHARGTDSWLAPLVPLIRRGIEEFLKNPRGEPKLTSEHLREFTVGWDENRLRRADDLYQKWLGGTMCGGGSGRGDFWSRDLGIRCLAYRQVQSVWDLLAVSDRHGWAGRKPEPGDDHRRMALWILRKWRNDCRAPDLLEVILNHLEFEDPVGVWGTMPYFYFDDQNVATQPRSPVSPRIKLLLALRPETDEDLETFVRILCVVRDQYLGTESTSIPTVQEVSTRVGVPPDHVIRLLSLTDALHVSGIYPARRNDTNEVVIQVHDSVFRIRGMSTVEDLVRIFEEQERECGRDHGYPLVHEKGTAETSKEDEQISGYRAAFRDALHETALHPTIEAATVKLFSEGNYRPAILDAAIALMGMVKARSGITNEDGADLMRRVFSRKKPVLAVNDGTSESDRDEQQGMMHIFEGVAIGLRNPRAHGLFQDTKEFAVESIMLLSFLAKRVDEAKSRGSDAARPVEEG